MNKIIIVLAVCIIVAVGLIAIVMLDNEEPVPTQVFVVSTDYQIEMARDFLTEEEYFKGFILVVYSNGQSAVTDMFEVRTDSTKTILDAQHEAMEIGYTRSKQLMKNLRARGKR